MQKPLELNKKGNSLNNFVKTPEYFPNFEKIHFLFFLFCNLKYLIFRNIDLF